MLLETASGPALERNLYISGSVKPLSDYDEVATKILEAFKGEVPKASGNAGVTYGFPLGTVVADTLEMAARAPTSVAKASPMRSAARLQ